jgi:hypothetical protein
MNVFLKKKIGLSMTTRNIKLYGQIFLLISAFSLNLFSAENLILNPSFETVDVSKLPIAGTINPKFTGPFPGLPNWYSAINRQGDMTTPDVYLRTRGEVPDNFATIGLQPVHGDHYAGIRSNYRGANIYSEILEAGITEPDFKKGDTVTIRTYFSTSSSANHRGTSTMQMWLKRANTNTKILVGQKSLQDKPSTWIFYRNEIVLGADGFFDRLSFNFSASSNNNLNNVFVDSVSLKVKKHVPKDGVNIITETETDTLLCAGREFYVYFDYEFDNLTPNTRFIAQLSDKNGSFLFPRIIGTAADNTKKIIRAILPPDIEPGTNYKVRVISQNPDTIGPESDLITILKSPEANIEGVFNFCKESNQSYSTTEDPSYEYYWSVNGSGKINGANDGPTVDVDWGVGSGQISVQVTKDETCQITNTKSVVVRPLVAKITGDSIFCQNEIINYSTPFSPDYIYTWTANGGKIIEDNGRSVKVLWDISGADTLVLQIVDENSGCSGTTSLPITVNPLPSKEISGTFTICGGSSQTYSAEENDKFTYFWEVENGEINGENNQYLVDVNWFSGEKGKIKLTITDSETDCENYAEIEVILDEQIDLEINGGDDPCANSTMIYSLGDNLKDILGVDYEWIVEGSKTFTISPDGKSVEVDWGDFGEDGTVTLNAKGDGKCFRLMPKSITIVDRADASFLSASIKDTVCAGDIETYSSTITDSKFNFTWNTNANGTIIGSNTEKDVTVEWFSAGTGALYLVIDGDNVCTSSSSFSVQINEIPVIDFLGDPRVCAGHSASISITNDYNNSYTWTSDRFTDPIIGQKDIDVDSAGVYTLTVMNENGCSASASRTVTMRDFNIELSIDPFNELNFDKVTIESDSAIIIQVLNDTITYTLNKPDPLSYFSANKISGDKEIEVKFSPEDIGDYSSTFKIISSAPCDAERTISVIGRGMVELEFILPENLIAVLNKKVSIPITYKLKQNPSLPLNLQGYDLDFQMFSDVFDSEDPRFFVGGQYVGFEISEDYEIKSKADTLLFVNGRAIRAERSESELNFIGEVIVGNKFIIPIPVEGNILTTEDCLSALRGFEFVGASTITSDGKDVELSTSYEGGHEFAIYNYMGVKQLSYSFNVGDDEHLYQTLSLGDLANGIYFAILKAPEGMITKKILINK